MVAAGGGGNGRRRPAPFSDIDLLIICDPRQQSRLQPLVDVAIRDLWDAGVQPACTMKSIDEACEYAAKDVQFTTSIMEPRLLAGSVALSGTFNQQISRRVMHTDASGLILQLQESRRARMDCSRKFRQSARTRRQAVTGRITRHPAAPLGGVPAVRFT